VSPNITVGTPDANRQGANSVGTVLFRAIAGNPSTAANEADVALDVTLTDVRRKSGLADYTGELEEVSTIRLTDRASAGGEATTVQDLPIAATVPCVATPDPARGASCSLSTTVNALTPGAVAEGKRAIWQLDQVQVLDGGPDGLASTNDNSLFAVQGVFVP
jgi:hypothetical protein